jgi:hypothetical protein
VLLPTPVWYRFFLDKASYGHFFSSLTTGLYLTFKVRVRVFCPTAMCLMRIGRLGIRVGDERSAVSNHFVGVVRGGTASELSASPSELLASPSELSASPSELLASPSEL